MSAAEDFLKDSHDGHFHVVYNYLIGKRTDVQQLWLSTGYFFCGVGRHSTIKPWGNEEQREQLLEATGRK